MRVFAEEFSYINPARYLGSNCEAFSISTIPYQFSFVFGMVVKGEVMYDVCVVFGMVVKW
jgi:hypothetical protein